MGFYETTYILHSALQEGRLNDIINVIEKKTKSIGAEILHSDNWGRKKLSYLIEKEKYGTYIFFQFKMKDAKNLIYSEGLDLKRTKSGVPVGVSCRVCERLDCTQRAYPPLHHRLQTDHEVRKMARFHFEQ